MPDDIPVNQSVFGQPTRNQVPRPDDIPVNQSVFGQPMRGGFVPPNRNQPPRSSGGFWWALLVIAIIILVVWAIVAGSNSVNTTSTDNSGNTSTTTTQPTTSTDNTQVTPVSNVSTPDYVPSNATQALNDPLVDNSQGHQWLVNENSNGSCIFTNNAYHVAVNGNAGVLFHACLIQDTSVDFSNFAYQVSMTLVNGECGGIIFRSHDPQFYYFETCADGTYEFVSYVSDTDNPATLDSGTIANPVQVNGTISVGVLANGSNMVIYINQQQVSTVNDTAYSDGQIGVIAANESSNDSTTTEVAFDDAIVWTF